MTVRSPYRDPRPAVPWLTPVVRRAKHPCGVEGVPRPHHRQEAGDSREKGGQKRGQGNDGTKSRECTQSRCGTDVLFVDIKRLHTIHHSPKT